MQVIPRLTFLVRKLRGDNHEREMALLDVLCDRERIGIDVGAKVGMYTYRIRDRSAGVIAFEPNPALHRYLAAVFGRRARIEGVAVSDRDGRAVLRLPHEAPGRATIEAGNALHHAYVEVEVATRTIDGYGLEEVGFIKIDVEGHELAVLAGAERTIVAQRPNLLVEANDEHHPDDAVVRLGRWLGERDYDAWFVDGRACYAIGAYDRARHWEGRGIENFVCVHRSRGDVREALIANVARRRLGRHRADRSVRRGDADRLE